MRHPTIQAAGQSPARAQGSSSLHQVRAAVETTRAEAAEIARLCVAAGQADLAASFIAAGMKPERVERVLTREGHTVHLPHGNPFGPTSRPWSAGLFDPSQIASRFDPPAPAAAAAPAPQGRSAFEAGAIASRLDSAVRV